MIESLEEKPTGPMRLLAREAFTAGQRGYATNDGVWHLHPIGVGASYPEGALFVTALVPVEPGRYADFEKWTLP